MKKCAGQVVILGDTCDAATMVPLAQDADVVVHEATNTLLYPIDQVSDYTRLVKSIFLIERWDAQVL